MEPLPTDPERAHERFTGRLRAQGVGTGPISFADFMEFALFDSEVGYYAAQRARVGKASGTDFYTSSNLGSVFGPLVAAAAEKLLGAEHPANAYTFVEIGAEPERAVLDGVAHPFAAVSTLRLTDRGRPGTRSSCGDDFVGALPPRAVVFSNELFDAQPFHRLIWRDGAWREMGVVVDGANLAWAEMPVRSPELDRIAGELPVSSEDGYTLDVPWRAVRLLEQIAATDWRGLFLAFDYGRTWTQISGDFPEGTGRAYRAHRQSGDLLAHPGAQDLTCHVCWDWLEAALRRHGFGTVTRESQEALFVKHATAAIDAIVRGHPSPLSPARSQLKQLLHPGLMGHKFEALWAVRP